MSLSLPVGWLDSLHLDSSESEEKDFEYTGKMRAGFVPVVDEAILGVDGSVDMIELRTRLLRIYSSGKDAYGLKVKGDSMCPRIQSGEYVVTEPNTPLYAEDDAPKMVIIKHTRYVVHDDLPHTDEIN